MSRHNERRRFQFQISLRTLLVVTTLAGICAGFYGPSVFRAIYTSIGFRQNDPGTSARWVTVTGIVDMDGKPLADASISFHTPNWGSTRSTDNNGAYSISISPGNYIVTVSKITGPYTLVGGGTELGDHPTEMGMETIPRRYSDDRSSVLKVTVASSRVQKSNFSLTNQAGDAPFSSPVQ